MKSRRRRQKRARQPARRRPPRAPGPRQRPRATRRRDLSPRATCRAMGFLRAGASWPSGLAAHQNSSRSPRQRSQLGSGGGPWSHTARQVRIGPTAWHGTNPRRRFALPSRRAWVAPTRPERVDDQAVGAFGSRRAGQRRRAPGRRRGVAGARRSPRLRRRPRGSAGRRGRSASGRNARPKPSATTGPSTTRRRATASCPLPSSHDGDVGTDVDRQRPALRGDAAPGDRDEVAHPSGSGARSAGRPTSRQPSLR